MTARGLSRRLAKLERSHPYEPEVPNIVISTWADPPPTDSQLAAEIARVCPPSHRGGLRPSGDTPHYHCIVWSTWDGKDTPPRWAHPWECSGYWGNQRAKYEAEHRNEARP